LDAYACTVYTSCKQTSFIAAAGVSSAVGFLNFLGSNGAPYSLSYINFTESWEGQTPGYLNSTAIPCETMVNDTLWGYDKMENSTCSFCAKVCPPPVVTDKIGFLDGLSWKIVGYSYLGFVVFTILFQIVQHCVIKKRKLEAVRRASQVNDMDAPADFGRGDDSSLLGRQGRPLVNNTVSSGTNITQSMQE